MERSKLRSKFQAEEVENNWAISYGDMITLLLGFFVIFFNIKSETMNLTLIKKDLDEYFKSPKVEEGGRGAASLDLPKGQETVPVLTSDVSNVLQIKSNLEGERILVEFPGVSFFDSASDNLTKAGKQALSDFSKAIQGHLGMFRLVVRGYTDANPLNSNNKYKDNLELSAFRSISAIRHLSGEGISLENMRIAGYGESNKSRTSKGKIKLEDQRKVVIVIEPLDHTERQPKAKKDGFSKAEINVESLNDVKITDRDPASEKAGNWFNTIKLPPAHDIKYIFNDALFVIDYEISMNSYYQDFVDYLVRKKLQSQGYRPDQIESMLKKYNEQRRLK